MAFPGFSQDEPESQRHPKLQRLASGKGNYATAASFTLTANAASSTLTDQRITTESVIVLMPTTANAAAALATTYVSARTNGSATVAHANNAQTDRTFAYAVFM